MNTNTPMPVSASEWGQLAAIDVIAQSWGLDSGTNGEELAEAAWGAKFSYAEVVGPGYTGDLFILHGGALGLPPLVVCRRKAGQLELVDYSGHESP